MRAALVAQHGVNFIDNHGGDTAQHIAAVNTGQQQVQRLGRTDQNMRRIFQHFLPVRRRRVAAANRYTNTRRMSTLQKQLILNAGQRLLQIALDIVTQGFKR